jgi:hypothetical protein
LDNTNRFAPTTTKQIALGNAIGADFGGIV